MEMDGLPQAFCETFVVWKGHGVAEKTREGVVMLHFLNYNYIMYIYII